MQHPTFALAYISLALVRDSDDATLASILSVSQHKNIENDLTGALLFGDQHFIQVLEGPLDNLVETMDRIRKDPRHHLLDSIGPNAVSGRAFPDWCMVRLPFEPAIRPTLSLLINEWERHGPDAARLLSEALVSHHEQASPTE